MNNFNFSIIPNRIFYAKNNQPIIHSINNHKVILVLDYLQKRIDRINTIVFNLDHCIKYCGYIPKTGKNKSTEQFRSIIDQLINLGLFDCNEDISSLKLNQLITLTMNKNELIRDGYSKLNYSITEQIMNIDENVEHCKLLFYYCYLYSRMDNKECDTVISKCFPSFNTIVKDTGIDKRSCVEYNKILSDLNLIEVLNAGRYEIEVLGNKIVRESENIYVLVKNYSSYESDRDSIINQHRNLSYNSSKKYLNTRNYKIGNHSINGKKGSLIKKKNKGTITKQEEHELSAINQALNKGVIDSKNAYDTLTKINKEYGDIMLSSYFNNECINEKTADKYYNLEYELGLIDNDGNLLVDYEYYRSIIQQYSITGDKIMCSNYVSKHKRNK